MSAFTYFLLVINLCYTQNIINIKNLESFDLDTDEYYLVWKTKIKLNERFTYFSNGKNSFWMSGSYHMDEDSLNIPINIDPESESLFVFHVLDGELVYGSHKKTSSIMYKNKVDCYLVNNVSPEISYRFIKNIIDEEDFEKISVFYAFFLAHRKDKESFIYLKEKYDDLSNEKSKKKIAYWIAKIRSDESFAFLKKEYQLSSNKAYKKDLIYYLYGYKSMKSKDFLTGLVKDQKEEKSLRKEAIYYLYQLKKKLQKIPYELGNIYSEINEKSLKKEIIYYLHQLKSEASYHYLLQIAKDDKEAQQLRKEAIYYLCQSKDIDKIKPLLYTLQNPALQKELCYYISNIDTDQAISLLGKFIRLKTVDNKLKREIIYYLGKSKNPNAEKLLSELFSKN